ncbi:MAG: septum formation initiator family protein [Melioribacteraceae bacterium]|nr:septum formation initiator family protein [Melioribacteraceae bacterium]
MKKKANIFKIIVYTVVMIISAYLIFNSNGLIKYLSLRSEISELETHIKNTEEDLTKIEQKIKMIKSNRDSIEKLAREKFNMKSKNESVIIINEN